MQLGILTGQCLQYTSESDLKELTELNDPTRLAGAKRDRCSLFFTSTISKIPIASASLHAHDDILPRAPDVLAIK